MHLHTRKEINISTYIWIILVQNNKLVKQIVNLQQFWVSVFHSSNLSSKSDKNSLVPAFDFWGCAAFLRVTSYQKIEKLIDKMWIQIELQYTFQIRWNRLGLFCVRHCYMFEILTKGKNIQVSMFDFSTCGSLKGVYSFVYSSCCRAVLPCSDLCVQSTNVEQHTSFFKGQRMLTGRDTCQRVIPERQTRRNQITSSKWKLFLKYNHDPEVKVYHFRLRANYECLHHHHFHTNLHIHSPPHF